MIMLMAKEQAKTDRRSTRYKTHSVSEVRKIADRLGKLAGVLSAACDEMEEHKIPPIRIAKKATLDEALEIVTEVVKDIRGTVEAEKLGL